MALVSQSEFAKRNGWSRQYVNKLVRQGRITLDNGKVNETAALQALKAEEEPSTVLRQSSPEKPAQAAGRGACAGGRACPGGLSYGPHDA